MNNDSEIRTIMEAVDQWPIPKRLELARQILATAKPSIREPPRRLDAKALLGILKTDQPAPTDEECRRIIEEERLKKYG